MSDKQALDISGYVNVPVFKQCPFCGESQFKTYNFDKIARQSLVSLSGHSLWYDVKFRQDGSIISRSAPCDDYSSIEGH